MKGKVKAKAGEKLDAITIERVISLLEQTKPITKKAACEILNISYNTARLNKIIAEFKDKKTYDIKRRKELKSKPITDSERKYILEAYLQGESLSYISEATFRSTKVIKNILFSNGLFLRSSEYSYMNPPFIDPDFIALDYEPMDLVYAGRYGCPAYIEKSFDDPNHEKIFRIRLVGPNRQQAKQPYYELIDLRPIQRKYGIKLEEMSYDDIRMTINQTLINAKKKKQK